MWLLDANISHKIKPILDSFSVKCCTAQEMGWAELKNGDLVCAAVNKGFFCLLTQDVLFVNSAAKALKKFPDFAIVLVKIRQTKGHQYFESFKNAFMKEPIKPVAGKLVVWPAEENK